MTMKTSREETKPIADGAPPQTSPAADLIANNFDVLTQILLRLPAKFLIRFKSVSKHWLSLLSDSQFAFAHSRLNSKPLISSFYFYYNERLESVSLNGSPTLPSLFFLRHLTGDYTILQSCNGLLLIKNVKLVDDCVEEQYIVCNPITQKFHVLARPGGDCDESCCLAFDPSKSPHYKVVFFVWRLGVSSVSLEMDIYSSETACWKNISPMDNSRKFLNGAFWNGAIYWLCDQYNLLRFDAETEKMMKIPYMPSGSSGRILCPFNTRYFGECGWSGRLLLIQSQSQSGARLKIWEMDKDCCRWNVKFHVDLKTLISEFPEMGSKTRCKFTLMGVVEGEKEDDFVLILAIPGTRRFVITYNYSSYGRKLCYPLEPLSTCSFPIISSTPKGTMTMTKSRSKPKPTTDGTPPETSPAAELIANNVDLLTQILLRIPAKSLIRFESVSKHWLSLISNSRFASTHSRLNPNPSISSLYFYYKGKLESVSVNGIPTIPSLSFLRPLTSDFTVLHSCNGLLLIKYTQLVNNLLKERYVVCNPTTQKFHVVCKASRGSYHVHSCRLALDPLKSPHYKVVLYSSSSVMDIYSSETACWKRIFLPNGPMHIRTYEPCGNGAFWNGAIYWLCDSYNMLRFDIETEKMMKIPYTQSSSGILPLHNTWYFGECGLGGRLLLIQSHSHSTATFKICEMDKDCCQWNGKFHVDLKTSISEFPEMANRRLYNFTVMCGVEGDKQNDFALVLAIPGKVISYNLQKKTWNVLSIRDSREVPGYTRVFPFVESLFPL
ncbi:hypothetical protein RHSIM_RhsimUnG0091900 [Rhododendron simsii]|uniref:F-box domain-containing protein n=1 Tax=Rhododendron simsii TaxID=118357 RepID=A0A834FWD2_RHOSS|nr:hypothetical protein RHSIM_RhsimUnG0091900 [Rhododendron simsii]